MPSKRDGLVYLLETRLPRARGEVLAFEQKLKSHPAEAFEWSIDAFRAASVVVIFGEVIRALTAEDSKATPASIAQYALDRVISKAKGGSSSTSDAANIRYRMDLAAWAEVYELATAAKE